MGWSQEEAPPHPPDFDTKLPLTKTKLLAGTNAPAASLERFLALGAKIDILRSVGSSLRCVSSGLNSYASFCTLRKPILPPTEDTVLSWSATFAPGKTFRNYVGHLKKACILAGRPTDWHSQAIRTAADGLINAKHGSLQLHNFIPHKELFKIVTFARWDNTFSLLAFISYLFSLRAPSETIQLRRDFADDPWPGSPTIPLRPRSGSGRSITSTSSSRSFLGGRT